MEIVCIKKKERLLILCEFELDHKIQGQEVRGKKK